MLRPTAFLGCDAPFGTVARHRSRQTPSLAGKEEEASQAATRHLAGLVPRQGPPTHLYLRIRVGEGNILSNYRKLIAALSGVVVIVGSAMADGVFVSSEIESIVAAAVAAFFVYRLPNAPPA